MGEERNCLLFRNIDRRGLRKGVGHCDIDNKTADCEGDVHYCEKPDAMRLYFRKKMEELRAKRRERE